jgi:hypothetical protein
MVSNQVLGARAIAGLFVLCLTFSGCMHQRQATPAAPEAAPAASPAATATAAPPDMTATEAAIESGGAAAAAPATSSSPAPEINPGAPKQYTVKRGDTLWSISAMYLKDPWRWPEVWVINPKIPNPHLIYPGDTLALAFGPGGRPQVSVMQAGTVRLDPRLRSTPVEASIPTIPYTVIAAFLSRPTVMTTEDIRQAPYVVAFRDLHQVAGSGSEVYVRHLAPTAQENARFAVVHVATPLVDPDDNKVVGYEGIYTATALVQRRGDPAKAMLIDPARETLTGDRLLSSDANDTPTTFVPRPPASQVRGQIIDVVGGTDLVGTFQVVVINRGKRHGLEPGNVLAIDQAGDVVRDLYRGGHQIGDTIGVGDAFAPKVRLPDERTGTVLVFKVFDRVSYGLIIGASDSIHTLDIVRSP